MFSFNYFSLLSQDLPEYFTKLSSLSVVSSRYCPCGSFRWFFLQLWKVSCSSCLLIVDEDLWTTLYKSPGFPERLLSLQHCVLQILAALISWDSLLPQTQNLPSPVCGPSYIELSLESDGESFRAFIDAKSPLQHACRRFATIALMLRWGISCFPCLRDHCLLLSNVRCLENNVLNVLCLSRQ